MTYSTAGGNNTNTNGSSAHPTGTDGDTNNSSGRGLVGVQMMQQVAGRLLQRSYHSAVCYKDTYIYLFGGITDDAYSSDLLELDTRRWTLKLIKGDPALGGPAAEEVIDHAVLGPARGAYSSFSSQQTSGNSGSSPALRGTDYAPAGYLAPVARSGHVASIHGDSMYIVGSYGTDDGDNSVVKLHQFKISEQVWRIVSTSGRAPAQRAAPAVCMFPENASHGVLPKITMIGGYSVEHNNCYNDVLTMYV